MTEAMVMNSIRTPTFALGMALLCWPASAWAQRATRSLEQSVNSIQNQVVGWIITIGWAAVAVYVAVMGLQWAMGNESAARNWWKPVLGAVLLGSAQWFSAQIRTAVGQ